MKYIRLLANYENFKKRKAMFRTRRSSTRAALLAAAVLTLISAAAITAGSAHGSGPGVTPGHLRMTAYSVPLGPLRPAEGSGACYITPPDYGGGAGPTGAGICGTNPQELIWPGGTVATQGGRHEIFVVGLDRAIWHTYQTSPGGPWTGWTSLGGYANDGIWQIAPALTPGIATFPLWDMEVRGLDDNLWCIEWTDSGWSGWSQSNCGPFF
jgi:hypothetical protein